MSPWFIRDDGGRRAAGFRGNARDCVCRSIAIASRRPYLEIYQALAHGMATQRVTRKTPKQARSARNGIYTRRKWFKEYMRELGFVWVPTMQIGQGFTVHLHPDELPRGRLVVSVSHHYVAMINGVVHDTWDSSYGGTRGVYGYWYRGERDEQSDPQHQCQPGFNHPHG